MSDELCCELLMEEQRGEILTRDTRDTRERLTTSYFQTWLRKNESVRLCSCLTNASDWFMDISGSQLSVPLKWTARVLQEVTTAFHQTKATMHNPISDTHMIQSNNLMCTFKIKIETSPWWNKPWITGALQCVSCLSVSWFPLLQICSLIQSLWKQNVRHDWVKLVNLIFLQLRSAPPTKV